MDSSENLPQNTPPTIPNQPVEYPKFTNQEKKSKKPILIISTILIFVLLVLLGFLSFYLGKKSNTGVTQKNISPSLPKQSITSSPKLSVSPKKSNKERVVKYFILKNLTVCNVTADCLNLTLTDDEVNKVKSEAMDFQNTVNSWAGDKLIIKVEPVVVSDNIRTEFTSYSYPADGWTLKRENVAEVIRKNVDKNTDFVLLTNPVKDIEKNYEVPISACGYSYGATDFDSVGGTSYSWIPINCAGKKAMIHEWLHQVSFHLTHFNGLNDIYNNGDYPKELCGNTKPEDDYKWFPNIDMADKVPDFSACTQNYDRWSEYCEELKPEDCDYKFDKHVLQKHFPDNINFIGNHCRDGIKNYSETSVDQGPECS